MTLKRVAAACVLALLTACGIPPEPTAREVQPPPGAFRDLPSPVPEVRSENGVERLTLYLVREGKLVAVQRLIEGEPTVDATLMLLLGGPTDEERASGLTSALPGTSVINQVRVMDGHAVVEITAGPEDAGRSDEVLAFGQIVCTLDSRPEITGVVFVLDGQPIGVPRGTAALSEGPLTIADYSNLIER